MSNPKLHQFVSTSNMIEGIYRDPSYDELQIHKKFLGLKDIAVSDIESFIKVVQPYAVLRTRVGLDVQVGKHVAPPGGPDIFARLFTILTNMSNTTPYQTHCDYETLHPFTDGNGRSGRMLWLWHMGGLDKISLGFLHTWYYQSLDNIRI